MFHPLTAEDFLDFLSFSRKRKKQKVYTKPKVKPRHKVYLLILFKEGFDAIVHDVYASREKAEERKTHVLMQADKNNLTGLSVGIIKKTVIGKFK